MRYTLFAVSLLALTGLGPQTAQALTYNELIDGDLSETVTVDLDFGTNTIIGTRTQATNAFRPFDDDDFFFVTLPTDAVISSATLTTTGFRLIEGNLDRAGSSAFITHPDVAATATTPELDPVLLYFAGSSIQASSPGIPVVTPLDAFDPFVPGRSISVNVGGGSQWLGSRGGYFELDYSLQLNVAAIPLPAAAWLLIAGLGALGLIGRRCPA